MNLDITGLQLHDLREVIDILKLKTSKKLLQKNSTKMQKLARLENLIQQLESGYESAYNEACREYFQPLAKAV